MPEARAGFASNQTPTELRADPQDVDWLNATKEANFDTDPDTRKTLSKLRSLAKMRMPT